MPATFSALPFPSLLGKGPGDGVDLAAREIVNLSCPSPKHWGGDRFSYAGLKNVNQMAIASRPARL